ncbi:NusG domain II-containing protein [Erysipelotrichaceae bacterium OttesenSCG-928-M19]|nr:NusG domain II-containing protein [Erysipelotrichaceae bacterium OttesenSCG-928-M19]
MSLKLNKYDIIITIVVALIACLLLFNVLRSDNQESDKIANVYFENELVHSFNLSEKKEEVFEIEATNGLVIIETKDGKVRVKSETSQKNICSIQSWSDSSVNPIVCLPNNLYIKIESVEDEDVDVFIK